MDDLMNYDQLLSHDASVIFEVNSSDGDGPHMLDLETPDSPAKEAEIKEVTAAAATPSPDEQDANYEEHMQLLQQLNEETDKASQRSSQLQMKLAEYLRMKAVDDAQLERDGLVSEQMEEYVNYLNILSDLKQQLTIESERAEQQAEELRLQSQEKLDKADDKWRAFMALKQDVAVTVLSRLLGKASAQAKVDSALSAEQLQQDELIKLRLKHLKLKRKVHRLETELREGDERSSDPLQLQYEQLQAQRLELKKHIEKQSQESMKLQKKISSSLELLSNIKEKLYWSRVEVRTKQEQLAEVEATVAAKREVLTGIKNERNRLQRANLRLKEHRGLLGNTALLRDFEDTADASDQLEEKLEKLRCRRAQIVFNFGKRKTNL
ncbi:cilia- and flagella-associated protein 184 [Sphaeramia orbicularis]|uniref:cilia- and flagella-associated protein 184 n=1 Tax=Sphaeramia orbicularis TaxID=375764 RepID=UPI001180DFFF|nr:coiled-coil domain-containing protein 96 [Sphaeramia orbicularis]